MKNFEVAIIGASLAGATTALALGRAQITTLLVDRATFPRRKACGEGLSPIGLLGLAQFGLGSQILSMPHIPISGYRLSLDGQEVLLPAPSDRSPGGIGIQRKLLDHELLKAVGKCSSVKSKLGCSTVSVERFNGGYILRTSTGEEYTSRFLVLASGVNSHLPRSLGFIRQGRPSDRFGMSSVVHGRFLLPCTEVRIFAQDKYEVYCTPVDSDALNVAVLCRRSDVKRFCALENFKVAISDVLNGVGFYPCHYEEILAAGPFGNRNSPNSVAHAILVGDALECFDPIGGMGMSHAIVSGVLAAKALERIIIEKWDAQKALNNYSVEREHAARPMRGFTRLVLYMLQAPTGKVLMKFLRKSALLDQALAHVHNAPMHHKRGTGLGRMIIDAAGYQR